MSDNYRFDIPASQKSIIKVLGVGGGGSNAVSHMYSQGIKDVEFVVCNTDSQALKSTQVPTKLQLGEALTEGLGAGANPEVGMNAALESKEEIRELLAHDTKMVFITAGMGGGTGTGAAPVIAQVARELGILTVGIVTAPFSFEGRKKTQSANVGIQGLKDSCDTVLVILNDKLREVYGNLSIRDAFSKADNVLSTAARSIAEIITVTSEVNVDFQDVKTVMKDSGPAVMGSAVVAGDNRARRAAEEAITSPLLNNTEITGARKILLSITYGDSAELTMDELTEITDFIEEQAGYDAEVIFGQGVDPTLEDGIRVTVIATGFADSQLNEDAPRKVFDLNSNQEMAAKAPVETPASKPVEPLFKPEVNQEPIQFSAPEPTQPEPAPEGDFSFEKPSEPVREDSEEKVIFQLDSQYEVEEEEASFTPEADPEVDPAADEMEEKRRKLIRQSQERIRRLKELRQDSSEDVEDFKNMLEVPAYKRRNVNLKDSPHSSENEVSRYNLNDDNDLLGNNKFLHDNVD